ncbi:MAG TPA: PAS domain S-box protein, partial [Bacteroidota bacterium]
GRDVSILYGTVDDSNEVHRATLVRGAYVREVVNRRKNGELFPSLLSASLLKDANGEVIGYMGISRDRTMEQRAEEELRTSEEKYRTLFEESRDVIFMCTLTGTLLDINPAGVDLLGYASKKELLDVNLFQGVILDLGEKEAYHHALDTNGFVRDFRITLVRKDGKKLTVTVTANAVRNSRGSIVAYRGIMRDVTERQQLEQQLMQSQKLESIGLLAGGIAHDINNVLTPIIVGIEFLKGKETNNEARKMFDMIGTSARRGAEIVKQVLTIGRRVTGERTEVQLKHLLKEMAKVAVETFPKSIRMQTSLPDDVWMVSGDATQLHQILLNLCVNARDAMPNGGTLTMGAKNVFLDEHYAHLHVDAKPGPYVLLQVSDTGSGIPGEIIHKIFEPFYTTKEPGKGTGLGLSTVHAIVKNHNGFVNVYSEVGKGTRFNVYLPAHQNAVMREQERAGRVFSNGNGETILVVDDEPSVLEITTATLEKFGYKTLRACDGTQAIALFAKNRGEVRAVITDMSMPVMDGSSTIKALRRIESNAKIIAASGLAEHKSKIEVAGLRVEAFLEKPYTAEALLGTLQEVLSS